MALVVGTNSYVSVADCNDYMSTRLHSDAWNTATNADKEAALVTATRVIDRHILLGTRKDPAQTLEFPRKYPWQLHSYLRKWYQSHIITQFSSVVMEGLSWWAEDSTPPYVKYACYEEALALLDRGDSVRITAQRQGVTQMSLGGASETYSAAPKLISKEAREFLRPWVQKAVGIL